MEMPLTEDEVRHVALLSRLELSDEEVELYAGQLGKVLDYVNKLNALDTTNVEPMITAATTGNVFRQDEPEDSIDRKEALRSAPDHDDGCFRVPRVID
jgi:aspartyl-tRNA(Asn)/glutamyl-tRNA(Gln) amidotransferase subunit C